MATLDPAGPSDDRGFRLLINTSVTLFWRPQILDDTTAWLSAHDYQVVRIHAGHWATEHDLHRDIAQALNFPDYYGGNLDALNDCMRDVVSQDYGWAPHTSGLAVVFTGYDSFAVRRPRAAQIVLDIMADSSRRAALAGQRLICLVQSGDPHIRFEPVGATPVAWNDAEWLDSRRQPE
jgi:hypothetical protein